MRVGLQEELDQLEASLQEEGELVRRALRGSLNALGRQDEELADEVVAFDDEVDRCYFGIETDIQSLLARQAPAAMDLRLVLAILHDNLHLERMADFYSRVLGFAISDRGELDTPHGKVSLVFLTRDPREHHQIVLASGRPDSLAFNPINQISFRVQDFAGLRELHRAIQGEAVSEISPVSHGNALSVYFRDPEGNRIELFVDTPWYVDQPMRIPMDMSLSDRALWQWAEATARTLPGYRPVEEWRTELAARLQR